MDDPEIFPAITGEVSFDQNSQKGTQIRIMGIGKNTFDIVLEYSNDLNTKIIAHIIDITNLCKSGNGNELDDRIFVKLNQIFSKSTKYLIGLLQETKNLILLCLILKVPEHLVMFPILKMVTILSSSKVESYSSF